MGSFAFGLAVGAVAGPIVVLLPLFWLARRKMRHWGLQPPWTPSQAPAEANWPLQRLDGSRANLSELIAGRVAFLNVWATWCPACVDEAASIDRLHGRFGERVAFVTVSRERAVVLERYSKKSGVRFPIYRCDGETPATFRTEGIPATFLITKCGRIALRHIGGADWAHGSVVRFLEDLLQAPEQDASTTPGPNAVTSAGIPQTPAP